MPADRVTVRLYYQRRHETAREDTNLDYKDDGALRRTLERMVRENRGTLNLDLSDWSLRLYSPRGGAAIVKVFITKSGETQIERHAVGRIR
jgi:hypothetical protein